MDNLFAGVVSLTQFMPHGVCFLWIKELLALHVVSDSVISIAYFSISLALFYFMRKRQDLVFRGMFLMFGSFILGCGITHTFGIWTIWQPDYWTEGVAKALTAAVSIVTAVALWKMMPAALTLPSQEQLRQANEELNREMMEQRRLRRHLEESEERFRSAFEFAAVGMALVSDTGRWLKVNKAICDCVGYSEQELLQIDFQTITHPDDLAQDLNYVQEMLDGKRQTYQMEKRYIHKNGDIIWALLSVSIIKNLENGRPYFISQVQDITGRKRALMELNSAVDELTRSNAELEQFAYVASHDLQEPLRMVISYLQLLERRYKGKLDNDADEFIHFAVDGGKRMQELINDLLTFSRIGTRGKTFEPVNVETVLKTAISNLSLVIEESQAEIVFDTLPELIADAGQLVQLFQNLISNSIKFRGEERPHIRISVQETPQEWLFSVQDNGIGIDRQFFDLIFVIFQRLHDRSRYPGTGIGLAICKKIVDRHGGRIWIEASSGKGADFRFTIPKA